MSVAGNGLFRALIRSGLSMTRRVETVRSVGRSCGVMTIMAGKISLRSLVGSGRSMRAKTAPSGLVEKMGCGVKRVLAKMSSGFISIWLITI